MQETFLSNFFISNLNTMTLKLWFFVACIPVAVVLSVERLRNDDVNFINSVQSSWKADYNFMRGYDIKTFKKKFGETRFSGKLPNFKDNFLTKFLFFNKPGVESDEFEIPKNYDARKAWPECKNTISTIRDQSNCGSCWAVSTAFMLSSRFCVATNGQIDKNLSADDLLKCCDTCKNGTDDGCKGGDVVYALFYLDKYGIVTGGEYGSKEGCMPYSVKPCTKSTKASSSCINSNGVKSGKCYAKCTNKKYPTPYKKDKHYGYSPYAFINGSTHADDIKTDILTYGPLLASLDVYEDFILYKSGIYHHVKGKNLGGHAVVIIGWGKENGTEYWLVSNSWGTSWGENGTAKIRRHKNGCDFGRHVLGILPYIVL